MVAHEKNHCELTQKYITRSNVPHKATHITLGPDVAGIMNEAFSHHTSLKHIEISGDVEYIGNSAFKGCAGLETVSFKDSSVICVDDYAFSNCTALTTMVLPQKVTMVSDGLFSGCTKLKKVTLSSQTETIGEDAFAGCAALTTIELPDTLSSIDDNAFNGCTALTQISIPAGVEILGSNAFSNCPYLSVVVCSRALFERYQAQLPKHACILDHQGDMLQQPEQYDAAQLPGALSQMGFNPMRMFTPTKTEHPNDLTKASSAMTRSV